MSLRLHVQIVETLLADAFGAVRASGARLHRATFYKLSPGFQDPRSSRRSLYSVKLLPCALALSKSPWRFLRLSLSNGCPCTDVK